MPTRWCRVAPHLHGRSSLRAFALRDDGALAHAVDEGGAPHPDPRPLGAGAMGVVFETIDPEFDRKVAIKLLQADTRPGGAVGHEAVEVDVEAEVAAVLSAADPVLAADVDHEVVVDLVANDLRRYLRDRGMTVDC